MADTEIELELGTAAQPGEYAVRVVRAASGGEPEGRLWLDVDDLVSRRAQLEARVLASAVRARGGVVPEIEQPLQQAGQELFEALFSGPVAEVYRASLAVARERGRLLRVVLRLTAPELAVLPWEALFDPVIEAYLCRKEPLVRHVPAPFSPEPLPVHPPLRILGLIASPRGLPALDVDTEQQHLQDALAGSIAAGRIELEWLAQASWDSVHERLLNEQWHVLHYIGHGDYDATTDEGRVALVGANGRADWVEASRLADLLTWAKPTPRLVVLNSCSSGQGGTRDLFSGTAATLVRSGISAVVAMQFSVSDRAAVAFPRGFYTAMAAGWGVDEAVGSGRMAILGTQGTLEWVTPVLYVRGNTRLFTLTPDRTGAFRPSAQTTTWQDVTRDGCWEEGLSAFFAGRYAEAVERFETLQTRYPRIAASVQARLDLARRQRDLAAWSDEADAAAGRGDWAGAIIALQRIFAIDATYRNASARLEQARTAQRRQTLLDEVTALYQGRQWQAVLAAGEELALLDPSHPDPDGMLTHARKELAEGNQRTGMNRTETTGAIGFLLGEHLQFRRSFQEFEDLLKEGDSRRIRDAFRTLRKDVSKHEKAEEMVLWPAVRAEVPGGEDLVRGRLEEERTLKELLAQLDKTDVSDSEFPIRARAFMHAVLTHAEQEEQQVFPEVRKAFDDSRMTSLGGALRASKAIAWGLPWRL